MSLLPNSKRCRLFEKIATDTWNEIIAMHRTHVQAVETGITNRIISKIRESALADPNIGVWANNGFLEIENGSDIDIFVEQTPGQFIWWALQAKVLRLSGSYEGVASLHGGEYQWQKLERLSVNSGCVARYLLFNGVDGYKYNGIDECGRNFSEDQFGCSLVKTEHIEVGAIGRFLNFNDYHSFPAQPWRIITCCFFNQKKEPITLYSPSQIKSAVGYYKESFGNTDIVSILGTSQVLNNFPTDAIDSFSNEEGRKPDVRIVIRTTNSIENPFS